MAKPRAVSMGIARNLVWRYAAALATAVALAVCRTLKPVLGDFVSSIVVFPAMAFAAWYGGVGPSILATVLTLLGVKYLALASAFFLQHLRGPGCWTGNDRGGVCNRRVHGGGSTA